MHRFLQLTALSAALVVPAAMAQDRATERERTDQPRYEDKAHHDTHEWNEAEDRAYRRWLEERHMKYHEFRKASKKEQAEYWKWRHEHPDEH